MNKLDALRQVMRTYGLDGLLIPQVDEFQNEHLYPGIARLEWLTGFTGSAGTVLLTHEHVLFFTDARYLIQAKEELPDDYQIQSLHHTNPARWITHNLGNLAKIGYDPWLFTEAQLDRYSHLSLVPLSENLIDKIWKDKPELPITPVTLHSLCYAGESDESKRIRLGKTLRADYALIAACDSIAWLLNIRGQDAPYTPLIHSVCFLHADGSFDLFVDMHKITDEIKQTLENRQGRLADLKTVFSFIETLSGTCEVDPEAAPVIFMQALEAAGMTIVRKEDPCALPKSCKNDVEIQGAIDAHIQDGIALCEFYTWLFQQPLDGELTEVSAADKLFEFRKKGKLFKGPSFPTISSMGAHGAIVHYRPLPATDVPLKREGLYLVDSGGQYLNGTTDVTRTFALGTPSPEEKDRYTRVLKGHIAIARSVFPERTTGLQLDVLARQFLWEVGLDYIHGTGHGVGSYLSVHEGPQRLSRFMADSPLEPGMIISNEPGYYKEGDYGIRIENLVYVERSQQFKGFYEFKTLTLVPLDLKLIDFSMLTSVELAWIRAYHATIFQTLAPFVNEETREWLQCNANFTCEEGR